MTTASSVGHLIAAAGACLMALAAQVAGAAPTAPGKAPAATMALELGKAPDVALRLVYESRSLGRDGVTRDSRYADVMFRQSDRIWIARELPADATHHEEAGPHAGHAHEHAAHAPLLLQRAKDGAITVRVVLQEPRRVIDVDLAHYGNVGYGGSWPAAYWTLDPVAFGSMTRVGGVKDGVQRYKAQRNGRETVVDWDIRGQYARMIEQRDASGGNFQRMTARRVAVPARWPWDELAGYGRGDYSDLLD